MSLSIFWIFLRYPFSSRSIPLTWFLWEYDYFKSKNHLYLMQGRHRSFLTFYDPVKNFSKWHELPTIMLGSYDIWFFHRLNHHGIYYLYAIYLINCCWNAPIFFINDWCMISRRDILTWSFPLLATSFILFSRVV